MSIPTTDAELVAEARTAVAFLDEFDRCRKAGEPTPPVPDSLMERDEVMGSRAMQGTLEALADALEAHLTADNREALAVAADVLRGYGHDAIADALSVLPVTPEPTEWEYAVRDTTGDPRTEYVYVTQTEAEMVAAHRNNIFTYPREYRAWVVKAPKQPECEWVPVSPTEKEPGEA